MAKLDIIIPVYNEDKNIVKLNGKPLIAYSIEDAINSGVCDTVLVTSEDDEIIEISKSCQTLKKPCRTVLVNF